MVATPNVAKSAPQRLNCSGTLGADLGDNRGSSAAGGHRQPRLFDVRQNHSADNCNESKRSIPLSELKTGVKDDWRGKQRMHFHEGDVCPILLSVQPSIASRYRSTNFLGLIVSV